MNFHWIFSQSESQSQEKCLRKFPISKKDDAKDEYDRKLVYFDALEKEMQNDRFMFVYVQCEGEMKKKVG